MKGDILLVADIEYNDNLIFINKLDKDKLNIIIIYKFIKKLKTKTFFIIVVFFFKAKLKINYYIFSKCQIIATSRTFNQIEIK
jgi:hypothetical protein